jgi:hypothetical protein
MSILCLSINTLNAQITTNETPFGLGIELSDISVSTPSIQTLTSPNMASIAVEDLISDEQPGPLRFAYPIDVNYTLNNSGIWQELSNGGKLWRLTIEIPDALSTNVFYDQFWLPTGTKFFVYNEYTGQSIGAITSEFLNGSKNTPEKFATGLIYGNNVTFEYYQPASVIDTAVILISRVDYGYRFVNNYNNSTTSFGDAASCNININCPEGSDWQNEKHAVARILIPLTNGSGWCSCSLVNNTNNDYTPYVLTANHCLSGLDAISNNDASQWLFYWEYEHTGCSNSSTEPTLRSTKGAIIVANNQSSDFALLHLTQNPLYLSGATPHYLVWDRSGSSGSNGVGIHHPRGDVKKISQSNCRVNFKADVSTARLPLRECLLTY